MVEEDETSFELGLSDNEYTKTYVQKHWPELVSAFEEYGISCELNLVECYMKISTTGKSIDTNIFCKARDIICMCLLARTLPPCLAVKVLNGKVEYDHIFIGHKEGGICSKYGIDEEQFHKRHRWLSKKSTIDVLNKLAGAHVVVNKFSVAVFGSSDGLKEMRRIVEDCIRNGVHPKSHICRLRRKRVLENNEHAKIRIRSVVEEFMKSETQLICCEHKYKTFMEALNQEKYNCVVEMIQDTDVLEKIADKFSCSDSVEVHAHIELILLLIIKCAPHETFTKLSCPSFIGRFFRHAVKDTRPKHVLVRLLSLFISMLDPMHAPITYEFRLGDSPELTSKNMKAGSDLRNQSPRRKRQCSAKSESVAAMLEILGDLLKLLDVSSVDNVLLTTYGKLQPPLGSHRLKIVQFIAKLLTIGGEAVEKELIRLGGVQKVLDLFFKYPYNNLVHGHIEHIIVSCLESKNARLVHHLLHECDLVGKILHSEKNFTLEADSNKPTFPNQGRSPLRIGNIGHLTRISNKIIQLGNNNSEIQAHLQEHREWTEWHTTALSKRNEVENVNLWACGPPTTLKDKTSYNTEDDYERVMVSLNMIENISASEKTNTKDIVITETQPVGGHSSQ